MSSSVENISKSIKLNMSKRIRRTPFTNRVEELGVSDFTVVNHMLLPKGFKKHRKPRNFSNKHKMQRISQKCLKHTTFIEKTKNATKIAQNI